MLKARLVSNWRNSWKWFSIHCFTLTGIINATWLEIPPDMKSALPGKYLVISTIVLAALGILGRITHQESAVVSTPNNG